MEHAPRRSIKPPGQFRAIHRYKTNPAEKGNNTDLATSLRFRKTPPSEVDVVAKGICKFLAPTSKAKDINDYRKIITNKLPEFVTETVYVPRFNLQFKPWAMWRQNKTPLWWDSYNDVKHHRSEHFAKANLGCTLYSRGGLLVSVYYFYKLKFLAEGKDLKHKSDLMVYLKADRGFIQLSDGHYPSYAPFPFDLPWRVDISRS